MWNVANGQLLARLKGHTFGVEQAEFSPDGRRIVTASWDKTARVWNATITDIWTTLIRVFSLEARKNARLDAFRARFDASPILSFSYKKTEFA